MCNDLVNQKNHESLKAYLAPTGLVSEPRGDLTCRGDLRLEVLISVPSVGFIYFQSIVVASSRIRYVLNFTINILHAIYLSGDVVLKYNLHYLDPVLQQ